MQLTFNYVLSLHSMQKAGIILFCMHMIHNTAEQCTPEGWKTTEATSGQITFRIGTSS